MAVSAYKLLSPELRAELEKIEKRYEKKESAILPVLAEVESHHGWVSAALEEEVARLLKIPAVQVHEVTTFYSLYKRKPRARYIISFCRTMSCYLMGAEDALSYLQRKLSIGPGEMTSDGKFSLETVECLGACELAPVMQINGHLHGHLTPEKIDSILDNLP